MPRYAPLVFFSLLIAAGGVVTAATHLSYSMPNHLNWVAGTGTSKGSSSAVLTGDPNKTGFAVIRVKMPDGYSNAPHYHAHPEYITVMQGTLLFGTGDKIDKSKVRVLPAGSFITVPPGLHHWSMARGETIEEVAGDGPQTNIPVKHGSM
ncbi:MAG TPA: cupin domain-containing protein [Candidatus Baltobacteraceae bacterium]|jgi:quercetin dioxygenase-like cupin family protein|nr:cupin domain-containing protein [Candidatus Baltobacteraceae bacterium]